MGDKQIAFKNKHSVSDFMQSHKWLNTSLGCSKMKTMRQLLFAGLKCEMQRIHDSLNSYYEHHLFRDKWYDTLTDIKNRNNVNTEMDSQTADKVQGKTTWGPRQQTKYDPSGFGLVCANRGIDPVPKPKRNPGNFEECYMLFCLALAERLNPHFQRYIKIATKSLDCKHTEAPVKTPQRCYEMMNKELKGRSSPKAAKILDYCKCTLAFKTVKEL